MTPLLTLLEILRRLEARYGHLPDRHTSDPLAELIQTILSQNTSDANSGRAFNQLWRTFGNWEAIARAPVAEVAEAIKSGGLGQVKAPRIQAVLKRIREERGDFSLAFLGDMSLEEARLWLVNLPGVGPKTAACVLLFSLDKPALPVDTHVHRVARRLGLVGDKVSAEKAATLLEAMVPPGDVYRFHIYLIEHGRRLCKAQRPLCPQCPLLDGCPTGQEVTRGAPSHASLWSSGNDTM